MPLKDAPWFPYVSALAWGVLVFLLVLLNSGHLLLAMLLGAVVAVLSRQIDKRGSGQSGGSASS